MTSGIDEYSTGKQDPEIREINLRTDCTDSIVIPVKLRGKRAQAVVDSGAQVTIISEEFFRQFKKPFRFVKKSRLKCAGIESSMEAKLVKDVDIQIGENKYKWDVYVAPINDEFILGLDFLKEFAAIIDFETGTITLNGKLTPAILKRNKDGTSVQISRVSTERKIVLPPNTMVRTKVKVVPPLEGEVFVHPILWKKGILLPKVVINGGETGKIAIVNLSNNYVRIAKDLLVGVASEVQETAIDEASSVGKEDALSEVLMTCLMDHAKVSNETTGSYENSTSGDTIPELVSEG